MKNVMVGMRHWGLVGLLCLVLMAALVLPQAGPATAWSNDPTVNTAICTASGAQSYPQIASDGSGGAIIAWYDRRDSALYNIYAQRVDSGGAVRWASNGVAICSATGMTTLPQHPLQVATDGSGGAIILWSDNRTGNYDIYAQRVASDGAVLWTANGAAVCVNAGDQTNPWLTPDGSGGAFIAYSDNRSGGYDIYAQRADSSGTVLWTAGGVAICTATGDQDYSRITSGGPGAAIICWYDYRNGNWDRYAQKVDLSGGVLWTANGVGVCTKPADQYDNEMVSDGSGGAIITWTDSGAGGTDIYAQRVDSSGAILWTASGAAICTASGTQTSPQIASDGAGGAAITWTDYRGGSSPDVYAQRVSSAGTPQWTANGVALCTASNTQSQSQITSDGSGSAVVTWSDTRSGTYTDIYAQRVDSAGTVQWTANGKAISTATWSQRDPKIVLDTSGAAIITWADFRNGSHNDVYAQWVDRNGNLADSVPPTVTLSSTAVPPTRTSPIPMTATFSENVSGFTIDDVAVGNGTALNFLAASGSVYTFDVAPGAQGLITVDLAAGAVQDGAGNGNTAAIQFTIEYDSLGPTVTLSSTAASTRTSPIPVTAAFSENVTGFTIADIAVGNGTADNFTAVSATVYTFDVAPAGEGLVTVNVAAAVAQDAAGNGNTAASGLGIVYDTVAPTVTLTSAAASPTETSPIPVTATFSEAVTGFGVGDIVAGHGVAGNFVATSGSVYTFDVTPTGQGTVTVDVAADVACDAAGNENTAAARFSIEYEDHEAPTLTLTTAASSPTRTSPIPVTVTCSELVTGFALGDVVVGNGSAGNLLAASGAVYTFDVIPAGQGVVTIGINAGVAQDAAGNWNAAAAELSLTFDSVAPTVVLTSTAASPATTLPVAMTATFSEDVTGFSLGDITVTNGSAGGFVAVSSTVYTFDVTPFGQGAVTVDVAADAAQDAAGNGNTAATQFSTTYDSVAPTVTLSSATSSPTDASPIPMTATFSENVIGFTVDDIVVVNGTAGDFVAVSPTVYTFNVTPAGEGTVTVSVAAGVAQDSAANGNSAAAQFSIDYAVSPSPSGSSNWGLIGGIIAAAVVVIGAIAGWLIWSRRRA